MGCRIPLLVLLVAVLVSSCAKLGFVDPSRYGYVGRHNENERKAFVFLVGEEYLNAHQDSKPSRDNPIMSEAEMQLLKRLLKKEKYCLNDDGLLNFIITSKQEKIFDMTFAHVIEESYNARPVTPQTYFGECRN